MSSNKVTTQEWSLTSFALRDAFTDFVLSRQAMRCSPKTLEIYGYTIGGFVSWLEGQSITTPAEVTHLVKKHPRMTIGDSKTALLAEDDVRTQGGARSRQTFSRALIFRRSARLRVI